MNDDTVGAGPATGPALTGSDTEALTQALRNLWPILDEPSRKKAIDIVNTMGATTR
jgi:hypothetical protein